MSAAAGSIGAAAGGSPIEGAPAHDAHQPQPRRFAPGSWLGLLGGGQLGRMFTMAAQSMGYKVCVLDPAADSPAGASADRQIVAAYDDRQALAELAALCGSVTTEFEETGAARDPFGNLRVGFEGETTVNRKDFGLTWNAALETGGVLVSEKVKLEFDISAIKNA